MTITPMLWKVILREKKDTSFFVVIVTGLKEQKRENIAKSITNMPAKKIPSLHHNLPFQDPYTGGPNVVFHRSHRSKKGRRDVHLIQDSTVRQFLLKKIEKRAIYEDRRYKNLHY